MNNKRDNINESLQIQQITHNYKSTLHPNCTPIHIPFRIQTTKPSHIFSNLAIKTNYKSKQSNSIIIYAAGNEVNQKQGIMKALSSLSTKSLTNQSYLNYLPSKLFQGHKTLCNKVHWLNMQLPEPIVMLKHAT